MLKRKKTILRTFLLYHSVLYPPCGHEPRREGRQTLTQAKQERANSPPPSPPDSAMTLETPVFRYICHQCFHQQASFLQRNSQPQLCSEGRTRSSSKSVTRVLCSYLCNCHRGFSSESCVRFVSCVEVTHSTLEPMVVPMPSVYMQPDYDSFGLRSFLH